MGTYILRRFLYFFPISFAVVFLVGIMIHIVPGDPIEQIAGDFSSKNDRIAIRQKLGLDQPLHLQILRYYTGILQGDLGKSLVVNRPVVDMIAERVIPTLELALSSIFLACIIGIPLGALSAVFNRSFFDLFLMSTSLIAGSMPSFWLGPLLILFFSVHLGWLPVSGRSGFTSILLPSLALSTSIAAVLIRVTKTSFLEQIRQNYVRTARSKGLGEFRVFIKHILKNSALSIVTVVGLQFGALVTGAIITEKVFDWPGIGTLIAVSIERRDYPVVQGCVFLFALAFLVTNLITDVLYFTIDPRIRINRVDK